MENIFHLGQILIHLGVVNHNQILEARRYQIRINNQKKLGEILIELGYITEEDLHRGLSIQQDLKNNP